MIFTTLKFLLFFCLVFGIYYIVPKKIQWVILLLASIYFYICASIKYVLFLIAATFITYFGALIINRINKKQDLYLKENKVNLSKDDKKLYKQKMGKKKKIILFFSILLTLSMLIVMKYTGFFIDNLSKILNIFNIDFTAPSWNLILPIGISFYTFMSIGYIVDVYREEYEPEKKFFKYFLFVSYFPHILQGPMDKYNNISKQLFEGKKFNYENAVQGTYRIIVGIIKKMVLADKLSIVISGVTGNIGAYFGINIFLTIFFYAIQLYADFSGYMDIAIGCSKILGIDITENFDAPYFSKSIAEYWRRWHISLGAWFRDYVYYPLLRSKLAENIRKYFKNRNNKYLSNNLPTVFALAILWTLIGFWHGSSWGFVIYGMYHGFIIILSTLLLPVYNKFYEKFPKLVKSKIYALFQVLRTFCLVLIGYFLFSLGNLKPAIQMFLNMFKTTSESGNFFSLMTKDTIISTIFGTVILLILDLFQINNVDIYSKFRKVPFFIRWLVYIVIMFAIILLASGEAKEFLYFQF